MSVLDREPWEEELLHTEEQEEEALGRCSECGAPIYEETAFAPEGDILCPACAEEWISDKTVWLDE